MSRFAGLVVLGGLVLPGCSFSNLRLGPVEEESFHVALTENARRSLVRLSFAMGSLEVEPGGGDVLEADCCTNSRAFRPILQQQTAGGTVYASLSSGSKSVGFNFWDWDDLEHEWDVRLGAELPMDLDLEFGAGEARLELGGVPLERVNVDVGAAEFRCNFERPNPAVMELLEVEGGAAEMRLTNLGNANFEKMTLDCGAGEFYLGFHGDWQQSATVIVDGAVGDLQIHVPDSIGVRVEVEGSFLASVEPRGLREDGNAYVNAAYGVAAVQLDIFVEFSLGSVQIIEDDPQL